MHITKFNQGDHSPDTLKFVDISLTMCSTHAHVNWYSYLPVVVLM